jgi:hypothetical protein
MGDAEVTKQRKEQPPGPVQCQLSDWIWVGIGVAVVATLAALAAIAFKIGGVL